MALSALHTEWRAGGHRNSDHRRLPALIFPGLSISCGRSGLHRAYFLTLLQRLTAVEAAFRSIILAARLMTGWAEDEFPNLDQRSRHGFSYFLQAALV